MQIPVWPSPPVYQLVFLEQWLGGKFQNWDLFNHKKYRLRNESFWEHSRVCPEDSPTIEKFASSNEAQDVVQSWEHTPCIKVWIYTSTSSKQARSAITSTEGHHPTTLATHPGIPAFLRSPITTGWKVPSSIRSKHIIVERSIINHWSSKISGPFFTVKGRLKVLL